MNKKMEEEGEKTGIEPETEKQILKVKPKEDSSKVLILAIWKLWKIVTYQTMKKVQIFIFNNKLWAKLYINLQIYKIVFNLGF